MLTRRTLIGGLAAIPATADPGRALAPSDALAAVPDAQRAPAAAPADFTAIPTEIVDAIRAWQTAHRAHVKAAQAYGASTHAKPIDKQESLHCWDAMRATMNEADRARAAMIVALWRVQS